MKEEKLQLIPQKTQRIVRNYYEKLQVKKIENLGEMDKLLEKYNLQKLNQEESEGPSTLLTAGEIKAVIKNLLTHTSS